MGCGLRQGRCSSLRRRLRRAMEAQARKSYWAGRVPSRRNLCRRQTERILRQLRGTQRRRPRMGTLEGRRVLQTGRASTRLHNRLGRNRRTSESGENTASQKPSLIADPEANHLLSSDAGELREKKLKFSKNTAFRS